MSPIHRHPGHRILVSVGAIGIGMLALLDNLHAFGTPLLPTFWPLALVLAGVARLGWPRRAGHRLSGLALVAVGGWLMARGLGYDVLSLRDSWPLFAIGGGVWMLLGGEARGTSATK